MFGWTLVQSVNVGSVSSFTVTGLNTAVYDYRISVRMSRGGGGSASDTLSIQFGDTSSTPNWLTATAFANVSGANPTGLTTSGGITKVAQVQNNATLYMGTNLELEFTADGQSVSFLGHSYFWENIGQWDEGPTGSQIGALKFTTASQAWTISYSLYAIRR